MAELCFIAYIYHIFFILFIYSSIDGHFSCFHLFAIVNNTAMNKGVHTSFQISVFTVGWIDIY